MDVNVRASVRDWPATARDERPTLPTDFTMTPARFEGAACSLLP